jgi:hypothetical protein
MRVFRSALLFVLAALFVSACGSPLFQGWRDETEDPRSDAEKCEAWKNHTWDGSQCVADAEIDRTKLTEDQCKQTSDSTWLDGACRSFPSLTETQCTDAANPDWTWYAGACVAAAKAACLKADPANRYENDRCFKPGVPEPQPDPQASGFAALCKQPTSYEVSRTVIALMDALSHKTDCDEAARALADSLVIVLDDADLSDLTPLKGLPKLDTLSLRNNGEFTDVTVLASLPNLRSLDLTGTGVTDLSPLAAHKKLTLLDMTRTALVDAKTDATCPTADGTNAAVKLFCATTPPQ